MNAAEITDKLGLHSLRQRAWYIQAACATSGDGLYEGLEWVSETARHVSVLTRSSRPTSRSEDSRRRCHHLVESSIYDDHSFLPTPRDSLSHPSASSSRAGISLFSTFVPLLCPR